MLQGVSRGGVGEVRQVALFKVRDHMADLYPQYNPSALTLGSVFNMAFSLCDSLTECDVLASAWLTSVSLYLTADGAHMASCISK
jgi:hypothetical protein